MNVRSSNGNLSNDVASKVQRVLGLLAAERHRAVPVPNRRTGNRVGNRLQHMDSPRNVTSRVLCVGLSTTIDA